MDLKLGLHVFNKQRVVGMNLSTLGTCADPENFPMG